MKPHLQRVFLPNIRRWVWQCATSNVTAYGETASWAYRDWRESVRVQATMRRLSGLQIVLSPEEMHAAEVMA